MNTRSRGWCITLNNYTEEDIGRLDELSTISMYLCYGKEVAPSTGTPHLQGYIYFENAKSFATLLKLLPKGSHIEVAKGNALENKAYCEKDGDFYEFGTIPAQGKRNDIILIKQQIVEGKGMRDIIESATSYQSLKTAELLLKYKERTRDWKPSVVWLYGASGCGKTKTAYAVLKNPYRKSNGTGKWWDGYDAHEDVIIDDIKDTSREMYERLLEQLDRYACQVETKGATRQFLAKRIIVTSILHPQELFFHFNDAVELLRRIDEIKQMGQV